MENQNECFLLGKCRQLFFFFSCLVNTTPALRSWVVPGHVIQCPDLTITDLTDPVYITSPGCTNGSISKWGPHNDLISSVTYSLFYWSLVAWQLPERYTTDHSIFGYTPSWQRMKGVKLVSLSQGKEGRKEGRKASLSRKKRGRVKEVAFQKQWLTGKWTVIPLRRVTTAS